MKQIKVIFSEKAQVVYNYLTEKAKTSKIEKTIVNAIDKKVELIKKDIHYGAPLSKNDIPKQFDVSNLFRVELPNYWRMLYTLTESDTKVEIIVFIIEIVDHKEYDKLFGYKKR